MCGRARARVCMCSGNPGKKLIRQHFNFASLQGTAAGAEVIAQVSTDGKTAVVAIGVISLNSSPPTSSRLFSQFFHSASGAVVACLDTPEGPDW